MDFWRIEKKWQDKWAQARIFESNPDNKKKFFITFPYPYVNGAPHVGHAYSSLRTDTYARFKRMRGFNVLYPQGFHATGEPILGVLERLKKGDESQARTLKSFGASDEDIEKFKKSPEYIVNFWIDEWKKTQKAAGFSIDWRRSFVTTALTPQYSRFVEWQYNTLKKNGYVVQGTHPVIWCPHDQSPTGDHDRLEGEGESPVEYVAIKFAFQDSYLVCATLRPETVFGVTNIWLHPSGDYVKAKVGKETWIISREATNKIKDQLKDVKIEKRIDAKELLGKRCTNPVTNEDVPILPGKFVDTEVATGIVMSVPSHAPFDCVALKELITSGIERYGVTRQELEPVALIKTEGLAEFPAVETTEKMGITSVSSKEELDKATSEVYKKEFHKGVLNQNCGEYAGMPVSEAKEKITEDFMEKGIADAIWDCTGVVCRCTTKCYVKILENQWFLKFSDEKWKEKVRGMLKKITIYPDEARQNFENTIDWLKDKACTRKGGLGTPLPWDKSWIVETLSDSTIYMAYYTIARLIKEKKITAETLTDVVFDYIFLGKGKNSDKNINEMKKEFEYFYPVDLRNSGKDLTQNHLTFYLFHHAAIWPESKWPRAISVNGFVNVEGEKMSKSKGNIISLKDMVEQFGADMVRLNIVSAAEGMDDADWRAENIKSIRARIELLYELVKELKRAGRKEKRQLDYYMLNNIKKESKNAVESYEKLELRSATNHALFDNANTLKWYIRRAGSIENANKDILKESLENAVKVLAPLAPHLCEEMWEMLGHNDFVSLQMLKEEKYDDSYEKNERFVQEIVEDVEKIKKLAQGVKATIYIAESWKFDAYKEKDGGKAPKDIISILTAKDRTKGKDISSFVNSFRQTKEYLQREHQLKLLEEAANFIIKETSLAIAIEEAAGQNPKAKASRPDKPGILLE